uniref:Uncharacterized protein n=1 Tax=Romanomermis culicivorax TaxID=13658 RepID=A0A915K588_ROMCU
MVEPPAHPNDFQVATTVSDRDLTDHEPAALDKLLLCHTNKQKLDFALNKMTQKIASRPPKGQKSLGKDNACTDFLSQKDDREKPHTPSMEDLAAKIFCPKFCHPGAILDTNHTATDILSVEATRPTEIDADINAVTHAMTKKPTNQPTLSNPISLDADYTMPPVEAIAIATQDKINQALAADPATRPNIPLYSSLKMEFCSTKSETNSSSLFPHPWSTKCFTNSMAQRF